MDLYHSPICGHSLRVRFAIAELGLDVTEHSLDLPRGEHKAPAYLAVNPLGKVPALVDGALVLWESSAIALYLAERVPERGLVPTTPEERAQLHKWLFFLANEVGKSAFEYAFVAAAKEAAAAQLAIAMAVLEQALGGRDHLLGDFSLADVAYAPPLALLARNGYPLPPRVAAWAARVHARPAWQRVSAREP